MIKYLVVPGIGGSGDEHWQTLWEQEWGDDAVRIEPKSWSRPVLEDWVAAIERAASSALLRDAEVVLIAHSLGCWAASAWLNETARQRLRGALLVAPPDPSGTAFPSAEASTFVGAEASPLPCPSVVLASSNDPYCTVEEAARLAARWGSTFTVVGDLGHVNASSKLGSWHQGRHLLRTLVG